MPLLAAKAKSDPSTNTADPITDEDQRLAFPAISKAWEVACQDVDDSEIIERTFFYPDPNLFRSVQSMDRLRKYVAAWLVIRPYWLRASPNPGQRPVVSTTKRWKSLFMAFYTTGGDLKSNLSRTSLDRRELMKWMDMPAIVQIDPQNFSGNWLGKTVAGPLTECITHVVVKQVIWELHELNFRQDLQSMNFVHRQLPLKGEMLRAYTLCFPNADFNGLTDLPFDTDLTLTNGDPLIRASSTKYLNILMPWPETPVPAEELPMSASSSIGLARHYEAKIARYYCVNFWAVMRRRPIPPAIWA
jgi:hypothetical protein